MSEAQTPSATAASSAKSPTQVRLENRLKQCKKDSMDAYREKEKIKRELAQAEAEERALADENARRDALWKIADLNKALKKAEDDWTTKEEARNEIEEDLRMYNSAEARQERATVQSQAPSNPGSQIPSPGYSSNTGYPRAGPPGNRGSSSHYYGRQNSGPWDPYGRQNPGPYGSYGPYGPPGSGGNYGYGFPPGHPGFYNPGAPGPSNGGGYPYNDYGNRRGHGRRP